jgi:hypothetical protein
MFSVPVPAAVPSVRHSAVCCPDSKASAAATAAEPLLLLPLLLLLVGVAMQTIPANRSVAKLTSFCSGSALPACLKAPVTALSLYLKRCLSTPSHVYLLQQRSTHVSLAGSSKSFCTYLDTLMSTLCNTHACITIVTMIRGNMHA